MSDDGFGDRMVGTPPTAALVGAVLQGAAGGSGSGSSGGDPGFAPLLFGGVVFSHGFRTASVPYMLLGGVIALYGLLGVVLWLTGVSLV